MALRCASSQAQKVVGAVQGAENVVAVCHLSF